MSASFSGSDAFKILTVAVWFGNTVGVTNTKLNSGGLFTGGVSIPPTHLQFTFSHRSSSPIKMPSYSALLHSAGVKSSKQRRSLAAHAQQAPLPIFFSQQFVAEQSPPVNDLPFKINSHCILESWSPMHFPSLQHDNFSVSHGSKHKRPSVITLS